MKKGLITSLLCVLCFFPILQAANPDGDLRIDMLEYYNLVVDHNVKSPTGPSPRAVYLGIRFCNDGTNDLTDVFAYMGDYLAGTPGLYPQETVASGPYTGTFSFTHEGGTADATRYIGTIPAGSCVTQYWLVSYPLLDAGGNRVSGKKPDPSDDLRLRYDVWATAKDGGTALEASDNKTLQLRAMISANANKIWPNTTSKVPNELLAAYAEKELGWRQTTATSHPGASIVLEGIWFDLGNIGQGFDNDGDFVLDRNFLLQPVGNPAVFDANCFRLVKVSGLIALKSSGGGSTVFEFEDQLHFPNNPSDVNGGVGMIFYEFAVLNGPCSSQLTPYQEVASGMNEKHNGDYGQPGGTLTSPAPDATFVKTAPTSAAKGSQISYQLQLENTSSVALGLPQYSAALVLHDAIPANTNYVAGSAASGNTLSPGMTVTILYSANNGVSWEKAEPSPASSVTNVQWWFGQPLQAADSVAVTMDVVISPSFPGAVLRNDASVSLGNAPPFLGGEAETVIDGSFSISSTVFKDNGEGANGESDQTYAVEVASESGVSDEEKAVGAPDNEYAKIYDPGDYITLDLGTTVPAGQTYSITWRRKSSYGDGASAEIFIEESPNNSTFTPQPFNPGTTSKSSFVTTVVTANVNTRYVKLRELTGSGDDFDLDALTVVGCNSEEQDCNHGVFADGIQNGNEQGAANVTVNLYLDYNADGKLDNSDLLARTAVTDGSGNCNFTNLTAGDYFAAVDYSDGDLPVRWTNTTGLEYFFANFNGGTATANFGFAPLLEVTNTLAGEPEVFETEIVRFEVDLTNRSHAEDSDNSSTIVAWSSAIASGTNYNVSPQNMLGAPDEQLAWFTGNWDKKAVVKGFDFGAQSGTIEKVEVLFSICTDQPVNNDKLQASFELESGGTQVFPDPVWSKTSSPNLNDYVGVPYLGFIVVDITDYQNWDWPVFGPEWAVTIEGLISGGNDGAHLYIDAIGVRVTTTCCADESGVDGEPGNSQNVITDLPLKYEYDNSKLEYSGASEEPGSIAGGTLYFNNAGPLYPAQTKKVTIDFKAIGSTTATCNEEEPECNSEPDAYALCAIPASGYFADVVISGNTTWSAVFPGVDPQNVNKKIRVRGTGTITLPSGDLKILSYSSLLVVDGPEFIVTSGNVILEEGACAIFNNAILRTYGNIDMIGNTLLCFHNCTIECGDEEANGIFNPGGSPTSANFTNDGGELYLNNVCMNVTHDFQLKSSSNGENILTNVCAEIGDQGPNNLSSGILDGQDSGNFQNAREMEIYHSEIVVAENIQNESSGELLACETEFRTLNGHFQNSGEFEGCSDVIWVDDAHQIQNNSDDDWEAALSQRRGAVSGSISGLPANSPVTAIANTFNNCHCSPAQPEVCADGTGTRAIVDDAYNADGLPVNQDDDGECVEILNKGSVTGYVFADVAGDGWNEELGYETGTDFFLEGVAVRIYGCKNSSGDLINQPNKDKKPCENGQNGGTWALLATDTTGISGGYEFKGLGDGYYYAEVVEATVPSGINQTADPDQTNGVCSSCDDKWKKPGAKMKDLGILGIGNDHFEVNFGYFVDESISGTVWEDADGDGEEEEGECPLAGVTVERVHSGCTQGVNCPVTVTDEHGKYRFDGVDPETDHSIKVKLNTLPAGPTWSVTAESDDTEDNDIEVNVPSGYQSHDNDFGCHRKGSSNLSGEVYYDWLGNGFLNSGDEGISGVRLNLYRDEDGDGQRGLCEPLVESVFTDSSGVYLFAEQDAGDYIIELDESSLPLFPDQTEDGDELAICSICDGKIEVKDLDGTEDRDDNHFGYKNHGNGEMAGFVFLDENANGLPGNGEPGIGLIEVKLEANFNLDTAFVLIKNSASEGDGEFKFKDLPDGKYRVSVNALDDDVPLDEHGEKTILSTPSSYLFTIYDEKVKTVNGQSCGECDDKSVFFGFARPGNVESYIFHDDNGNGTMDWSETGIAGATVFICAQTVTTCNAANALDTIVTADGAGADEIGLFRFTGLRPGEYRIAVDTATLPAGFKLTADPSTDGIPCYAPLNPADPDFAFLSAGCDSEVDGFHVWMGSIFTGADFGYRPQGVIGDHVWLDRNNNSVKDETENGVPGLEVVLTNATAVSISGLPYNPFEYHDTTRTDVDGYYSFGALPDATWQVQLIPPANHVATYDADGTPDFSTDAVIAGGKTDNSGNAWCGSGQDCSLDVDFGIRPGYDNAVSGTVCFDLDEDGKCNTGGESFPQGVEVFLFDKNGVFFGQETLDINGYYQFNYLPNDTFTVSVSKATPPLSLTSLTTSLGDTPAFIIAETPENAFQQLVVDTTVTGIDFGFTFSDPFDLGDLPSPFPTGMNSTNSGPLHRIPAVPALYLGTTVDAESTPVLTADATGDDSMGDDEDGVTFTNPGSWTEGTVASGNGGSVSIQVAGDGWLVGYADFTNDGDFTDDGELIFSQAVTTGTYNLNFGIPAGTPLTGGQDYYFRFRLLDKQPFAPAFAFRGVEIRGEVEDYMQPICKNMTNAGTLAGNEKGCVGFDPAPITEAVPASGGGGAIEYRWENSTDGGITWNVIAGANSATYDPPYIAASTYYRRCVRRSKCQDYICTFAVVKEILTNFTGPGIIVGNEENCGVFDPGFILNVLSPDGGDGTGTEEFQWQKSTDGGTTWVNILNSNTEFYDPGVISQTTTYRRGGRKGPCMDYIWSNSVTKMVAVNYTVAGTIAGDEAVCGGFDPALITSVALPSGGVDGYQSLQWEKSTDGGATWQEIAGATAATYDPVYIVQTTSFRRKARRTPCAIWVNSNLVTKSVKPFPLANIATYPAAPFLCEMSEYEFAATDAGANVSYSWNFGGYATPATAIGKGPHTAQFDVPDNPAQTDATILLSTTLNGCVSNDNVQLSFRPAIVMTNVAASDPTACQATDGQIIITAAYPAGASVEYSVDGGLTWSASSVAGSLGAGVYDVKVRYTGGECEESFGSYALSDPPPQADILISSNEECTGQVVTVEAVPGSGSPTFSWTFGSGAVPNSATGPGPHSIVFNNGGAAAIALSIVDGNCTGFRDSTISIVANYTNGGTIPGDGVLCSTYDPGLIGSSSNPTGGVGGTTVYGWEYRESDGQGGWSTWQDIAGANAGTYDPAPISVMTEYRRKVRRAPCAGWVYSDTAQVQLVLKPNLVDDSYNTACPGFPYTGNVGSNDLGLSAPYFTLGVPPANGTLDFDFDGEFIYTPNSTFCGTDEFTYIVCNEQTGCCDTALVVIDMSDTELPTMVNIPQNVTVSCDDQIPLPTAVEVWENCQTVSLGLDEVTTQGADSCSLHTYDLMRVWTSVDYCSNSASGQQVVTVADNTAPDLYRIYTLPNGKRMVAGVMENVSHHWKTIKLPIQFTQQPVVFTQVITRNEASPVIARLRNVSTTQFQMRLQEEEAADNTHAVESVAWVAIEPGTFSGSAPFEVGSFQLTSIVTNLPYAQTYTNVPRLFANIQTNNDADPANVRWANLTSAALDIWTEEETSFDPETTHNLETVGYMAMRDTGDIATQSGEVLGEMGRLVLNHTSQIISLRHVYHNPVVIFSGISSLDASPVTIRVTNVTATSFEVQLEEWAYEDGLHGNEDISYMVIEGSLPFDAEVACDMVPGALAIGTQIVALDNCDETIELNISENAPAFSCAGDTLFTRTWTVEDDCGNLTSLVQTYTLRDTTPPQFSAPPDATMLCSGNVNDLGKAGDVTNESDNCATGLQAVFTDNDTNLVNCTGYIIRTWSLTDNCGNTTMKTQFIYMAPDDDNDGDGVVDYYDLDDDNDGIPDLVETGADDDGDGVPNYFDRDSDNDGIPDLIEIGGVDKDGDGVVDNVGQPGWDHDGDGFAYGVDGNDIDTTYAASGTFDPTNNQNDRDGDGIPNYLDLDSDNDGLPGIIEVGSIDTDGDGRMDYLVPGDPLSMPDNDNDGFSDWYDPDDDNLPGAEDAKNALITFDGEKYGGTKLTDRPDFDIDVVPNYLDSDSDNDGISDLIETGGIDTDGDGKIDSPGEFSDANADGFDDTYQSIPLVTTDPDAIPADGRPNDNNGDGTAYNGGDTDLDGRLNCNDPDADGDSIPDTWEIGIAGRDVDGDGVIDNFSDTNADGLDDVAAGSSIIITENDGALNDGRAEDGIDADSTAFIGAATDGQFGQANANPDIDDDGDGIPNYLDTDTDNDFLADAAEGANFTVIIIGGNTNLFNPDTDGDGILDGIEDANGNGIVDPGETDPLNPNSDGDPYEDGEEDSNGNGIVDPGESDPRDPCDPILSTACRGITLDLKVKLLGGLIQVDTSNLMRDELRFKGLLPVVEPYSKLPNIRHVGETVTGPLQPSGDLTGLPEQEIVDAGLMYYTGNDAPVDWVLVELRLADYADSVFATKAAILQRDGDVRDLDDLGYVKFKEIPAGNYFVAIRHRNHLGVMTGQPYILSPKVTKIDFTGPNTVFYENNAAYYYKGEMVLWPGDFNGDGKVIYQGPGNDVVYLFNKVFTTPGNTGLLANYILNGYLLYDINLDGNSIYQGPGNDSARVLFNAVLSTPENIMQLANFILLQKLP
jgi:SdrD B-like domain/Bacterial Ig domain/GEVED domain